MIIEEISISTRITSEEEEDRENANINKAIEQISNSPIGLVILGEGFVNTDDELDDDVGIPGIDGTVQLRIIYQKEK